MTIMANVRRVIVEEDDESKSEQSDIESDADNTETAEKSDQTESDGESDNDSKEKSDGSDDNTGNAGWVDSIAKILKTSKPKGKKTLVLSKAKKLSDVRKQKPVSAGFQVEKEDGAVEEEQLNAEAEETKEEGPPRKKKKEILSVRAKPNVLEKDRERLLMKIATKGVVQLFNAVKMQQKDIKTKLQEAGPLEVKKDKVLKNIDKRAFLDVLMGEKSVVVDKTEKRNVAKKETEEDKSTWSVLRDDFMMGAKMKDWDKALEEEEDDMEVEVESD